MVPDFLPSEQVTEDLCPARRQEWPEMEGKHFCGYAQKLRSLVEQVGFPWSEGKGTSVDETLRTKNPP